MFKRTVSPDDLFRLKREREAADRAYNEALTALDGAVQQLQHRPGSLPAVDERQLGSLNELLTGISDLLAPDGTFIHPRAAERTKSCSAYNRPAPEAVTSAHADVKPTGAAAFRAFLRHRSTLVPFRRQPSLHSAARQPAGTGSAQILRSISPKSRRFRCPSASRSQ